MVLRALSRAPSAQAYASLAAIQHASESSSRFRLHCSPHRTSSGSASSNSEPHPQATPPPKDSQSSPTAASVDAEEVRKFGAQAHEWWSPRGPFSALHALNPARVHLIRDGATSHFNRDATSPTPLSGLSVVDVGCGGGILAESLARLGACVTAIDAAAENIGVATAHAAQSPALQHNLTYHCVSAEALVERGTQFDIVVASEVIEHVRAPADFATTLAALRRAAGAVFITTLNRTPESYALAIVAAERVLGMAPKGAHDWNKFITPEELQLAFAAAGLQMELLAGFQLDVLSNRWRATSDARVNYGAMFTTGSDE